jgi:hypothetical protein
MNNQELRVQIEQELAEFHKHASTSHYYEKASSLYDKACTIDEVIRYLWEKRQGLYARVRAYRSRGRDWELGFAALHLDGDIWLIESPNTQPEATEDDED